MRVYIPFGDGSSVSFDGERFTLHRRPVDLDSGGVGEPGGKAAEAWERNRGALTRALESAWMIQREQLRRDRARRIYSRSPGLGEES